MNSFGRAEKSTQSAANGLSRLSVGAVHEVRARWVVLATGAVPQALSAAGLCERHTPSGVALRGYVKNDALVGQITQLHMVWHPRLRGGYGWIFPAPGSLFDIGAGLTGSHCTLQGGKCETQDVNLRLPSALARVRPWPRPRSSSIPPAGTPPPAADALLQVLQRERLRATDVKAVVAQVHQAAIDVLGPVIRLTAHRSKFSMGTVLGLIAVHGQAGLTE